MRLIEIWPVEDKNSGLRQARTKASFFAKCLTYDLFEEKLVIP